MKPSNNLTRIMVLGRERSGTKWLTNLIANHDSLSCVQSQQHCGVLESNLFQQMKTTFGDLTVEENKTAFRLCFQGTTFFRITDVSPEFLHENDSNDYVQIFFDLMDEYAQKENRTGWVQKANSLHGEKILEAAPNTKFIVVQREPIDNLLSSLLRNSKRLSLIRTVQHLLGYTYASKIEKRFCHRHKVLRVRFEDLKSSKQKTLKKICDYLDLEYSDDMTEDRFPRNTTFKSEQKPKFSTFQRQRLKFLFWMISMLPLPAIRFFRNQAHKRRTQRNRFVAGTFD